MFIGTIRTSFRKNLNTKFLPLEKTDNRSSSCLHTSHPVNKGTPCGHSDNFIEGHFLKNLVIMN